MSKIMKTEEGKVYDSFWMEGVENRAFHISKRSVQPELHIDAINRKIQIVENKGDIVIVFGKREGNRTRGKLIYEN